ncbi:aldehyde dehydrogenase family protein [Geothrix sp. PMB-07]|uniref:aldehyde dehydrogenase family protein n=1 Tax=Geothrix sp. PMB-07 TaxID=3068640 RepID=UPI00274149C8|nr:aldehyde dehydrogenase family protein [Geothrix sp. PMB-07]WLT33182.1 aldehyde dehydrogenase family protein [Geothrix sp. PMB-07]
MYLKANSPHAASAGKSVIGFNVINGKEVEGDLSLIQSKSAVDSRDLVGMFPDSGEKDVARAAKAAADAFGAWSHTPLAQRQSVARQTAAILTAHLDKLARIIIREIGMTPREAESEVRQAIEACTFFAAETEAILKRPRTKGSRRRPLGVCAILATGCSPLAAPARKILPAILSGNTVVWKPSDNAPTAAYLLLRAMMEAGLPHGVVNTVNGRGRAGCGKHFLAGIDKGLFQSFSFVGSADLGRHVGEICGRNLIQPNLEVVGKGFMVILPDANLKQAAADAALAAFSQAGQGQVALGNILLHQDCAEAFKKAFLAKVASLEVGNPLSDPDVAYGPILNARTATTFREHWEKGQAEGATLLTGGEQWNESHRTAQVKGNVGHGVYMQPCVWEGVTPEMGLFRHRVLGPTVNLITCSDLDQAMGWLGAAEGSLAHSLYTRDRAAIQRFQRESRADLVLVNATATDPSALLPFTGHGTRPGRQNALEVFSRWQSTNQKPDEAAAPMPEHGSAPVIQTDWASL